MLSANRRFPVLLLWALGVMFGGSRASRAEDHTRLLFLGSRCPIILDVTIDAGTRSVAEIRRQYAEGVFRRLDANGDGRLSADEAEKIPQAGRLQAGADVVGDGWKTFDSDKDGAVSQEELAFHIQSAFGPELAVEKAPPRRSQTARLSVDLDLDKDGRITRDEIVAGLERLRSLDFDDDDALSVAELQPFPRSIVEARQVREREQSESLLLPIGSDSEFGAAAERCAKWYADSSGQVTRQQMPDLEERWFRAFDRNRDGSWDAAEFQQYLRRAQAAYGIKVQLPKSWIQFETGNAEAGRKPKLDLGGVPVELTAADRQWMQMDAIALHKINFRRSDGDKNGYLDPAEFGGMQANVSFESVDLDGNGQVTLGEVEDFFRLDVLAQQSRLLILLSDETPSLFDLIDPIDPATLVRDFRLGPRDMRLAADRLLAHDHNGNGTLELSELVRQFQIRFTRPELFDTRPMPTDNMPQQGRGQTNIGRNQSGPIWFARMDRNLDGEISWREFLGPRETFRQLDKDGDGFIMEEETLAAERLREAARTP